MRHLGIGTLRWAVGGFYVLVGAMMLVAPHQFNSLSYTLLQPYLPFWGAAFLLIGANLLATAVLRLSGYVGGATNILAGAGMLLLAYGFAVVGGWVGVTNFIVMGIAVAAAPLIFRQASSGGPATGDLFAAAIGTGEVLAGLVIVALPGQFNSPLYDSSRGFLPWLGVAFAISGLLLVHAQLRSSLSPVTVRASHLFAGSTLLAFCLTSSIPNRAWVGIAYYGGLGVVVAILPWLKPRLSHMESSSLQTRFTLALVLAASIPLIATVTVISDQQERSVTAQSLSAQETLASMAARAVEDYVNITRTAIAQVAMEPDFLQRAPAEQRSFLHNLQSVYPDVIAFSTFDANGNPLARSDRRPHGGYEGLSRL